MATTMKNKSKFIFYMAYLMFILIFVFALFFIFNRRVEKGYMMNQTLSSGMTYDYYVPDSYRHNEQTPLLVVLHGGHQSAEDIASITQMNQLAEEHGFIVLYPQQSTDLNPSGYWNWFLEENQQRAGQELDYIIQMVQEIQETYTIDENQQYLAGLSAGAAMALNLQILYPDFFQGVAMAAGIGYGIAENVVQAYSVMAGNLPDVESSVLKAYQRMPSEFNHLLRLLIFQGDEDDRVDPANASFIVQQIALLNDYLDDGKANGSFSQIPFDKTNGVTNDGLDYQEEKYMYQQELYIQYTLVKDMGHVWPGWQASQSNSDPNAPLMSQAIVDFFSLDNH